MKLLFSLFLALISLGQLNGVEVVFSDQHGIESVLDIDGETPLHLMNTHIENHIGANVQNVQMLVDYKTAKAGVNSADFRDYYRPVTPDELDKINYIIKTLGTKKKIFLLWDRSSLNNTGDQLRHLHPLRFLATIMTNKDNVRYMRIIRDKGKVWDNFGGELKDNLKTESTKNNLSRDVVENFAQTVGIDFNVIWPDVQNKKWTSFIDKVIYQVPYKK